MKIRTKINLSFLIIFVVVSSLVGFVVGTYTTNLVKKNIFSYLRSGNLARAEHIHTFIQDQKKTALILAAASVYIDFLKEPIDSQQYPIIKEKIAQRFVRTIEADPQIYEVFIMDLNGKILVSSEQSVEGSDEFLDDYFIEGKKGVFFKDAYLLSRNNKLTYGISAPIKDSDGTLLGVSMLRYDTKLFYSITKNENGLGKTEENFLVNKDKFFITPSLFSGEAVILKQKVETENVNDCFNPKEIEYVTNRGYGGVAEIMNHEIVESQDYRNIDVIATHAYIPETGWCLITKVDKSEALAFRTNLIFIFLSIFTGGGLMYVLVAFFISKKITDPIKALTVGTQKVEQGDFDYKTNIKTEDEIGELSRSFDKMTAVVKTSRVEVEIKVKEQTQEIIANGKDLEEQQKAILNILEDVEAEKDTSQKLATDLEKFKLAVENASDHIVITDSEGIILYANRAVERITGFSNEEIIGKKAGTKELWGGLMDLPVYEEFWKQIKEEKKAFIGEFTNHRKNGETYIAEAHVAPIISVNGTVQFFVGIERDITHAKEVDRMKTEFISLASHQLRTPLSAMKWFSEMLLAGDAGTLTAEQKEYVGNINVSNERMIALVNSLLNISRIESGRIMIDPEPTDVGMLIADVVKELQMKVNEKKLTFITSVHPDLPKIMLDPKLIREVFKNLCTNAIKYTPGGGEITVFVSRKDNELISQVTDTGYGIPQKDKEKVFGKFYRGENIVKLETDGTGLGLYLVKSIIDSSGGKIWFDSVENKGTTFWFSLPMSGMIKKEGDITINA